MAEHNNGAELVYGIHAVEALLQRSAARIEQLCYQQDQRNSRVLKLLTRANELGVSSRAMEKAELDRMTSGRHQGLVACCAPREELSEQALDGLLGQSPAPLVLILDGVTDPHNLGACLRSAEAAGVTLVILPKHNSAPLNEVVGKVASGAVETLPVLYVTNLVRTMRDLQERGLWITGAAVEATQSIFDADLTGPRVVVMGSEGKGLRRLTRETCDELIYIPMAGAVSSLNVSVATGICLFEALRQRCLK